MIFDIDNDCNNIVIQKKVSDQYVFKIIDSNGGAIPTGGDSNNNILESYNGNSVGLNGDGTIVAISKLGECQAYVINNNSKSWDQYGNTMYPTSDGSNVNKLCINDAGDTIVILECSDDPGGLIRKEINMAGDQIISGITISAGELSESWNLDDRPSLTHEYAVPLQGGSGSNARAIITVTATAVDNIVTQVDVTSIRITNAGSNYLAGDILSIAEWDIERLPASSLLKQDIELVEMITEGKYDSTHDIATAEYTDVYLFDGFLTQTDIKATVKISSTGITSIVITDPGTTIAANNSSFSIRSIDIGRWTDDGSTPGSLDTSDTQGDMVKIVLSPDALATSNSVLFTIIEEDINAAGEIKTFKYMAGEWNKFGDTFQSNIVDRETTITLDATGNCLAIGKPNGSQTNPCGEVFVYNSYGGQWQQKGSIITLKKTTFNSDGSVVYGDGSVYSTSNAYANKIRFGYNIKLNKNGNFLCISCNWGKNLTNDANGYRKGAVLIYEYDNFFWLQKGDPIIGIENQQLGYKIDINNGERDIIISTLTNAYTYVQAAYSVTTRFGESTTYDDPTFGDPDHQTVEKQQQEIKTYIYDNATGEWDGNKFNTLYKPSSHIDANIKINDVGNKNCYYFKKLDIHDNDGYYFNVHVWPSGTVQVAETSVNVLNNEISTSSDVIIDGTLMSDVMKMKGITTDERNALTAEAGMIIFNSTDNKHQAYNGTSWNNLY